jgi:hypothetical protein
MNLKFAIFWDVVPCSLAESNRHDRGAYCRHHHGPHHLVGGDSISETSAYFYQKIIIFILAVKT